MIGTTTAAAHARMTAALNRLCKWRAFFAGWQLGTRPADDAPTRALRDAIDARLVARVELSAVTRLLLERRVFTGDQLADAITVEAGELSADLARRFPGVDVTDAGLTMTMPAAAETLRREGFPA